MVWIAGTVFYDSPVVVVEDLASVRSVQPLRHASFAPGRAVAELQLGGLISEKRGEKVARCGESDALPADA